MMIKTYGITYITLDYSRAQLVLMDDTAEILDMWVDIDHRRQGLGEQLLSLCVTTARAVGCKTVFLHVAEDNIPAHMLYAKYGFRPRDMETHMYMEIWQKPKRRRRKRLQ